MVLRHWSFGISSAGMRAAFLFFSVGQAGSFFDRLRQRGEAGTFSASGSFASPRRAAGQQRYSSFIGIFASRIFLKGESDYFTSHFCRQDIGWGLWASISTGPPAFLCLSQPSHREPLPPAFLATRGQEAVRGSESAFSRAMMWHVKLEARQRGLPLAVGQGVFLEVDNGRRTFIIKAFFYSLLSHHFSLSLFSHFQYISLIHIFDYWIGLLSSAFLRFSE